MSDFLIGALSFPALLLAIFLRVPIGLAMFLAGFIGLVNVTGDLAVAKGCVEHPARNERALRGEAVHGSSTLRS